MDKENTQNNTLFKLFLMVSIINLGFSIYMKSKAVEAKKKNCNCSK
ncbi:hypothetical protein [Aquimarina macrocephali]|nr:hypothetical protein [Aquimarina macrocephali]